MEAALEAFLLGFPALFSIVNPISGAFIFRTVTLSRPPEDRCQAGAEGGRLLVGRDDDFAAWVAPTCWPSSASASRHCVSVARLRSTLSAWALLNRPETTRSAKKPVATTLREADDIVMFPLTIPFTTGPARSPVSGTTLGFQPLLRALGLKLLWFFIGMSSAAIAIAATIRIAHRPLQPRSAFPVDGPTGSRTMTRLFAFLLRNTASACSDTSSPASLTCCHRCSLCADHCRRM